jgi:hypothetical protein
MTQINRGDAPVAPSFKKSAPASGRKRFEQMASFKDRLAAFAEEPPK